MSKRARLDVISSFVDGQVEDIWRSDMSYTIRRCILNDK